MKYAFISAFSALSYLAYIWMRGDFFLRDMIVISAILSIGVLVETVKSFR